jgi:hypothetical protein
MNVFLLFQNMKKTWKALIITLISSVLIFFSSVLLWPTWLALTIPMENMKYINGDMTYGFRQGLIFASGLALIPIALFLIFKIGRVVDTQKRFLSLLTILGILCLTVVLRREHIRNLTTEHMGEHRKVALAIEKLCYEEYLFLGIILGASMAFVIFRQKRRPQPMDIIDN